MRSVCLTNLGFPVDTTRCVIRHVKVHIIQSPSSAHLVLIMCYVHLKVAYNLSFLLYDDLSPIRIQRAHYFCLQPALLFIFTNRRQCVMNGQCRKDTSIRVRYTSVDDDNLAVTPRDDVLCGSNGGPQSG